LGSTQEALAELDHVAAELQQHPGVLLVRYEILSKAELWNKADEVARELVDLYPDEPQFWIWHAYSTRRMDGGGIPQAKEILDKARELIPTEALIRYNLGCYECQLGNLQSAWEFLEQACQIGDLKTYKSLALNDLDLKPLWPKIKQIEG
jgi:tetratricopeptide (TPR) repeat protein